jgi:hypothetical protein
MSESRFEHQADPFERTLLASARRDAMSPERKRALAVSLGVAAAGATVLAAGTAKAGAAAGAAVNAKGSLGLAAIKWIAAGVAGGALALGAAKGGQHVYETSRASSSLDGGGATTKAAPPRAAAPVVTEVAPEIPAAPAPETAPEVPAAPGPEANSRQVVSEALATKTAKRRAQARPSAPSLAGEVRTIERARAALAAGNTAAASAALDDHDRDFPRGALAEEARVLRIDVLAKRGERARAESAARAFLSSHPESPHAGRLRELLGEGTRR